MKKVVTINLNGNAYQVDEDAYDALNAYLADARARLSGNPDIDEIMTDLEQAIADKLNRFLGSHKTVVSGSEIDEVVDEMGPVDSPEDEAGAADDTRERERADTEGSSASDEPRRLYRLVDGDEKMLAGVCAGLAAYSGIDVAIVRIIFIVLTFASSGLAFIAYLVLMFVVPPAKTPQQRAAAFGVPFDARGVIDRAKSRFSELSSGQAKPQQRFRDRQARLGSADGLGSMVGLAIVVLAIFVGIALMSRIVGLIPQPFYYGPRIHSLPWWLVVLMFVVGIYVFARIIGGDRQGNRSLLGGLLVATVQVFLVLAVIWLAYHMLPFVRDIINGLVSLVYPRSIGFGPSLWLHAVVN